ncbi:transcriptional regulator domain-containing protein [Asticcacaulis sp.]|uniref:transcriptional regulator domain-containing protein n=1 Tax=Asticcacaulis sp. TaxID=1872648 RepID=UPI0039C86C25
MRRTLRGASEVQPDWLDDAYYEYARTLDRRHWAWLWLKRNPSYQAAAADAAARVDWISVGPGKLCLRRQDLNSLF